MNPKQDTPTEHKDTIDTPVSFKCKVILDSDEMPKSSRQWTRAKRSELVIDSRGLTYANHFTSFNEIEEATIHVYKSALFLEYCILSIKNNNSTHYFGVKYSDYWKGDLPFEVKTVHEETPFLLFRKSLIILIIIYIFWEVVKR